MEKMQLIPARGRLLFAEILLADVLRIQLIPARGRLRLILEQVPEDGRCSLAPRGDSLHVFSPVNFRHFIDNSHILCYTSW